MIRREIDFEATPEEVFDVIEDFKSYPQFISSIESTKVREKKDGLFVTFEINLIKKISYTIRVEKSRPHSLKWTFVEGEMMKENRGGWTLKPLDGGSRTHAIYEIEVAFGWLVPKSVVEQLTKIQLPLLMEAFKVRIEERAAASS